MSSRKTIDSYPLTIGEVFTKPFSYEVPSYQRDYAWTLEEVKTFWEDIISALLDRGSGGYFLGAIVIAPGKDEQARNIVDGQQRLATLSMVFSAISAQWKKMGDQNRADGVANDYLGSEDRRTGDRIPKLSLNEINDPNFQDIVITQKKYKPHEIIGWHKSNVNLLNAYNTINELIYDWLDGLDDKEEYLIDLELFIKNKISIISIEVGDEIDAFVIFETLNDRGLDLAVSDLIKNYLFALAGSYIEKFKGTWREISMVIGDGNLTQFLRHHWLSTYGLVRERDLYRELRQKVKNTTKARQFVNQLRSAANYYSALVSAEHDYWDTTPTSATEDLQVLLSFKLAQYRPVLLAAMQKLKPRQVANILRQLLVVSFRYSIVSKLGTGNLEKVYADTANAIWDGSVKTAPAVFARLKPIYVSDDRFEGDFSKCRFTKPAVARYTLSEINKFLEVDRERKVPTNTQAFTLEHVLPKTPGSSWKLTGDKNEIRELAQQIGNLTLLERGMNKGIGNSSFKEKKSKAYSKSNLAINKKLTSETASLWDESVIEKRGVELASIAKEIWAIKL